MARQNQQQTQAPAAVPTTTLEKFSGTVEKVDAAKKDISVKMGKEEQNLLIER